MFAVPLRWTVGSSPSLANPFSGAISSLRNPSPLRHRAFAFLRFSLCHHPGFSGIPENLETLVYRQLGQRPEISTVCRLAEKPADFAVSPMARSSSESLTSAATPQASQMRNGRAPE